MGRARNGQLAVAAPARRNQSPVESAGAPSVEEVTATADELLSGRQKAELTPEEVQAQVDVILASYPDFEKPSAPLAHTGRYGSRRNLEEGEILLPRSQADVDAIVARWKSLGPQAIAHDLECAASPTVPNGTGLHPHLGTTRLAQFAVRDGGNGKPEAIVIDCWKQDPRELVELLGDRDWETIIHFAQMEARWIGYEHGVRIENLTDTRQASKLLYDRRKVFTGVPLEEDITRLRLDDERWARNIMRDEKVIADRKEPVRGIRHALGAVSLRELDYELDKTQQNSYWDAVTLTDEQLKYAGEDVLTLLDLDDQFRPHITDEDRAEMQKSATKLADKYAGLSPEREEELANYGITPEQLAEGLSKERRKDLEEMGVIVEEPYPVKGCEAERAKRMIDACRSKAELKRMEEALPYLRIHHSNRGEVDGILQSRRSDLERGRKTAKPVKVKLAGWKQPF